MLTANLLDKRIRPVTSTEITYPSLLAVELTIKALGNSTGSLMRWKYLIVHCRLRKLRESLKRARLDSANQENPVDESGTPSLIFEQTIFLADPHSYGKPTGAITTIEAVKSP
jgi:hypothetical protein